MRGSRGGDGGDPTRFDERRWRDGGRVEKQNSNGRADDSVERRSDVLRRGRERERRRSLLRTVRGRQEEREREAESGWKRVSTVAKRLEKRHVQPSRNEKGPSARMCQPSQITLECHTHPERGPPTN